MSTLSVSLLQIDIDFGNPKKNKEKVLQWVEKAVAERKTDVIVLPELWTTGYDLTRLDKIADPNGKETMAMFSELAKVHNVHIVAGSVAKQVGDQIFNTIFVFNRQGEMAGEYSKAHLFRLMDEEKYLTAGDAKGLFQIEGVDAAGVVCYDIRFPEWIRAHTAKGAGILFIPAEWPTPRIEHWRTLLQSRAIENQCFVVACNRVGKDPNNAFGGHSMIIDPWGEVIAEAGDREEILSGAIDTNLVHEIRKMIPIYEDRRPDLYN